MLIGPLKEKFQELRTKDNVDHAGPSQPLELLNHGLFSTDKVPISLSNNSLTAQDPKETKDAMEDGHQALLTTSKLTESLLEVLIPMSQGTKLAKLKVEASKSTDTQATADAMDWAVELTPTPSPLLLMLLTGHPTDQESSIIVEPQSTMLSF